MICKIVLTLEQDEQRGTNAAMEETITLLSMIGNLPMMKVVVTMECEEMIAARYRETLHGELRRRPIGIIAKVKTTTEDQITTFVPQRTPMDDVVDEKPSVTLSSRGRSVTINADSLAAGVLRDTTDLFEE